MVFVVTKTFSRPPLDRSLDLAFRALAEPSRRNMLDRLAERSLTVSELAAPLNITVAAAVQHVQALEMSGLIQTLKSGRVRTCALLPDGLEAVEGWLADRRTLWSRRLDRLGSVLDEQDGSDAAGARRPTPRVGTGEGS